jgi:hypothetical protein
MRFNKIPACKICGQQFDDIFEATDHLLDDNGEQPFDPKLILPSGYVLLVGSLLRTMYKYAGNPDAIKDITQSTYATLYAAETSPTKMKRLIEDMVIQDEMRDFDKELITLLEDETNEEDGE